MKKIILVLSAIVILSGCSLLGNDVTYVCTIDNAEDKAEFVLKGNEDTDETYTLKSKEYIAIPEDTTEEEIKEVVNYYTDYYAKYNEIDGLKISVYQEDDYLVVDTDDSYNAANVKEMLDQGFIDGEENSTIISFEHYITYFKDQGFTCNTK